MIIQGIAVLLFVIIWFFKESTQMLYPSISFKLIRGLFNSQTCFGCVLSNHVHTLNLLFFLDTQAVPNEEPLPNTAFSPPDATSSLRQCGVLPETVYRDPVLHLLLLRGVCVCLQLMPSVKPL